MFDYLKNDAIENATTDDIRMIIQKNKREFYDEVKALADSIKDGADKELLKQDIRSQFNKEAAITIIRAINRDIRPYEETRFIRQLDNDSFGNIVSFLLENVILIQEIDDVVQSETGLDEEQIGIFIMLLNTVNNWIISRRYSYGRYLAEARSMFRFSDEKASSMWEIVQSKKKELSEALIMDNCIITKEISRDVDHILEIFSKIADAEIE